MTFMVINNTLLCIHRDPAQLSLLKESGYELVTATNASDGLRLFKSRLVDAVVLEHQLGPLDGSALAAEIKQVRPKIPIVMLIDRLELPDGALKSVDAIVAKSDGAHFLWATVHFVLNVKPLRRREQKLRGANAGTSAASGQVTGRRGQWAEPPFSIGN
jgi:DNA-binding response OmpR family regulator